MPRFPEWLLYLFAATEPFLMFAVVLSRDSIPFWIVVVMVLYVAGRTILSGGRLWVERSMLYLGLFLVAYAVSAYLVLDEESASTWLGRTPLDRAGTISLRVIYVIVAFWAFVNLLADMPPEVFRRILMIQILVGALIAAFGILQYVSFAYFGSSALNEIQPTNETFGARAYFLQKVGGEKVFRAAAIFSEPSWFGFYLVPLAVKIVVAWSQGIRLGSRRWHVIFGIVICAALLVNFSLTALLASITMMVFAVIQVARTNVRRTVMVLVAVTMVIGAFMASPLGAPWLARMERVLELRDPSTMDRLFRVYTSALVFLDHPLLGVGPGGYAFWYPRLGGLDRSTMVTPLNMWLYILTDAGLLGFIPFAALVVRVIRRGARKVSVHPLVRIFLWSVVAHVLLLTTLDIWYTEMVWFEFALLLCLAEGTALNGSAERAA